MLLNENGERFIQIKGIQGMGKLPIAKYAVHYCLDRKYFKDGALQINAEGIKEYKDFINLVFQ